MVYKPVESTSDKLIVHLIKEVETPLNGYRSKRYSCCGDRPRSGESKIPCTRIGTGGPGLRDSKVIQVIIGLKN